MICGLERLPPCKTVWIIRGHIRSEEPTLDQSRTSPDRPADAPPRPGAHRHAIVDQVEGYYLGQPDTLLLEDGRTILVAYPNGHGGPDTILKRSTDAGLSWSDRLPVPASFVGAHNAPTIHRLIDSDGKRRIFLNTSFPAMRSSLSEDDGKTWTDLELMWRKNKWRRGFKGHAPMKSVIPIDCGGYLGMYHDHFEDDAGQQVVIPFTTVTTDGGLTWSDPIRTGVHTSQPGAQPCEPCLLRNPADGRIVALLRENSGDHQSLMMYSDDDGQSWSEMTEVQPPLTGSRQASIGCDCCVIMAAQVTRVTLVSRCCPMVASSLRPTASWPPLSHPSWSVFDLTSMRSISWRRTSMVEAAAGWQRPS